MNCPKCFSDKIYTIDNSALDNRSGERGEPQLDCEVYAEAQCHDCKHTFNIQGSIQWNQPTPLPALTLLQAAELGMQHALERKEEFRDDRWDNGIAMMEAAILRAKNEEKQQDECRQLLREITAAFTEWAPDNEGFGSTKYGYRKDGIAQINNLLNA